MRKTLIILASVGFLAVIVAAALSWNEIMTRYHLQSLRKDPEHLGKIVHEPERSSARAALRQYLESKEGKSALVRDIVPDLVLRDLEKLNARDTKLCLHAGGNAIVVLEFIKDGQIGNFYIPTSSHIIQLCREFLVNNEHYSLLGYPARRFQFLNTPPSWGKRYCGIKQ